MQTPEPSQPRPSAVAHLSRTVFVRSLAAVTAGVAGLSGLVNSAVGSADLDLGVGRTIDAALATQRFTTALIAVCTFAVAPALWRGKRWAAFASVGFGGLLFAVATASARPTLGVAVLALGALVTLGRSYFAVRSDPLRVASTLRRCLVSEAVVLIYGTVGLFVLEEEFTTSTPITRSVSDGVRLLFLLPASTVAPAGTVGAHFIESVRLLSLVVISITVLSLLLPVVRKAPGSGRDDANRLATAFGTNRLTHFTLWNDKLHTFDETGQAMVSYHTHYRVAMALGGPVGANSDLGAAVAAFEAECARNGWTPAFHQVGDSDRLVLELAGYRLQPIGAEAIVDVQAFSLEGSHWKKIRSSLSMLKRDGIEIEELAHPIDVATLDELEEVSIAWLASGGHRERSFTLGQFSRAYVEETRVLVARRPDGRIDAFVNIVPLYASNVGTFDLMRRRPDSANGVMDGLFVAMIELFKAEGLTGMNLGMAPLAQLPDGDLLDKGLNQLRERGDQYFNFQGLEAFKEKWRPNWEPRFLAYRSASDLPAVLRCVQTIGELDEAKSKLESAKEVIRRFPVSLAIGGLTFWLMLATALDPELHQQVLDGFGLSVPGVVELDVWRPIASALVQAEPGVVIVNAMLILSVLPIAEWLMGSRRTLITFWLGHLLTLVPLLGFFQLLGELGDDAALRFTSLPDAGSSAGLWALCGALIHQLPSARWRWGAVVGIVAGHATFGALDRDPPSAQHAVAVLVGFTLAYLMDRYRATAEQGLPLPQRLKAMVPTRSGSPT